MIRIMTLSVLLLSLTATAETNSNQVNDSAYFTVSSIETKLVSQQEENLSSMLLTTNLDSQIPVLMTEALRLQDLLPTTPPLTNPTLVLIDQIINLGERIWKIVEAGKPVVNLNSTVATALPKGVTGWNKLENWQAPSSATYSMTVKNLYGMTVVSFSYRIVYIYGGSYQGRGQYIGYASIQPADVYVAWGYTLNAQASVPSVFNTATNANPVAAMQLVMQYTISTVMNTMVQSQSYYVTGNGKLQQLN